MNELIKKLKDQCWVEKCWDNDMWIEKHIDLELFAESIVRECVRVVNAADDSCEDYYGTIIKEHFGVEQ